MIPAVDRKAWIKDAALRMGFDLCGIAPAALPDQDKNQYLWWLEQGFHGEMSYMERQQRQDLRLLFPEVRSVICAAMVYNSPYPRSVDCPDPTRGWISRYGWGDDYHHLLRDRLEQLLAELREVEEPFEAKIYVDTGPLLERAIARAAGMGWVAKNTCLIHQKVGSWFLVGEILTSLELEPDAPVPDRCGTCRRCIDACPTAAIVEPYVLDATRCIAYFTIEARGAIPEEFRPAIGRHVFGCDICQDVCPWNRKPLVTFLPEFQPRAFVNHPTQRRPAGDSSPGEAAMMRQETAFGEEPREEAVSDCSGRPATAETAASNSVPNAFNPPLEWLASLTEEGFNAFFRKSPVKRARYRGMLRNVAIAMGNSLDSRYLPALGKLAGFPDSIVQEHARWAIDRLTSNRPEGAER